MNRPILNRTVPEGKRGTAAERFRGPIRFGPASAGLRELRGTLRQQGNVS